MGTGVITQNCVSLNFSTCTRTQTIAKKVKENHIIIIFFNFCVKDALTVYLFRVNSIRPWLF